MLQARTLLDQLQAVDAECRVLVEEVRASCCSMFHVTMSRIAPRLIAGSNPSHRQLSCTLLLLLSAPPIPNGNPRADFR
jgi:hypothetical protein